MLSNRGLIHIAAALPAITTTAAHHHNHPPTDPSATRTRLQQTKQNARTVGQWAAVVGKKPRVLLNVIFEIKAVEVGTLERFDRTLRKRAAIEAVATWNCQQWKEAVAATRELSSTATNCMATTIGSGEREKERERERGSEGRDCRGQMRGDV